MDEPITLNCPNHGPVEWVGDVFCKYCMTIYLCSGVTEDENGRKKHQYPDAPPKGVCTCDKRLFGGTDFTARPMCHECALTVMRAKAAKEGKVLWGKDDRTGMNEADRADPRGDGSYDLYVFKRSDDENWMWQVGWPRGLAHGDVPTRELARKHAEQIYTALTNLEKETTDG